MQGLNEWLLGTAPERIASVGRRERSGMDVEEREVIRRRMRMDKWTLDRGAGYYATERVKKKLPCLVQTGKHAGRSRVRYVGVDRKTFWSHMLRRDFFTTAVNAQLIQLIGLFVLWYFTMLLGWSTIYYIIWRWNKACFIGFHGFRSAFMYATETQQTIGYGERATGECWSAALAVSIHSLQAVLLDSVILGIVFSRISHPRQRSRTVLISDCACIARRDGQLKLMFRIADIQSRSVIDPRVRAVMYTWGPGRRTAEGERIPVTAQDMSVSLDSTLLLPATAEHTIDEASPLWGHTLQSLEAVGAEIVVTFEASTELGDTFMVRQSYLPSEIHWGHTFVGIIRPSPEGETQHEVDLSRFHDVEPQPGLGDEMTQPHRLSKKVVSGGGSGNVVPARLLCENTLVLSEDAVVACRNGRAYLMFRLGDTFPGHVLDVQVSAHLYRWQASHTAEGELLPYEDQPLDLEPASLLLRYPVTLMHELDPARSPIAHWASQKGMRQDADAEVVVVARGTLYSRQEVVTRTRVYSVLGDIKWGHAFLPVVLPGSSAAVPGASSKLGAAVDWSHFHGTTPITMPPLSDLPSPPAPAGTSPRPSQLGYPPGPAVTSAVTSAATAVAPWEAAGPPATGGAGGAGGMRPLPPPLPPAPQGPSRAGRQYHSASPMLRPPPEHSASTSCLVSLAPQQPPPPPQQPQPQPLLQRQPSSTQLVTPAAALASSDLTLLPPGQPQLQPQPQLVLKPPALQVFQRPLLQRSPSALLLQPGGGDMAQARPASATAFAAPGVVSFGRRADDEAAAGGNSDDLSSTGNTSYGSVGLAAAPANPPGTARQTSVTGLTGAADKGTADRTWHQTRSLFSALENIQMLMAEEQAAVEAEEQQRQEQEQQQHHHHHHPSQQQGQGAEEEAQVGQGEAQAGQATGAEAV